MKLIVRGGFSIEYPIEKLIAAAICYEAGDPERIHHFLKVHAFSRQIGLEEGLDSNTQFVLETVAVVHDVGIRRALEVYGSSAGKYQEELGPDIADAILTDLNWPRAVIDRVRYLIAHHHTYTNVDGLDYRILLEADALVNLYENDSPVEVQKSFYEKVFRTEAGKRLCQELYPAVCE